MNLKKKFGDEFNIIIWTDLNKDKDYYCIPFSDIKHLFIEENKTKGDYNNRWTTRIIDNKFLMANSNVSIDISKYYGQELFPIPKIELDEDYYIENAKAEINIRIGQSKFRMGVLENFGFECALSGIKEISLLRASHIIPWAHKKEFRGDIANGISLYSEYDALFDKGYISFTNELETIITTQTNLSAVLINKLNSIKGKKLNKPIKKPISIEYLDYHRENRFNNLNSMSSITL